PVRGEVVLVGAHYLSVRSLAASADGDALVVLNGMGPHQGLVSFVRDAGSARTGGYRVVESQALTDAVESWLSPVLVGGAEYVTALWTGTELRFLRGPGLLATDHWEAGAWGCEPTAVLLQPSFDVQEPAVSLLAFDGGTVRYHAHYLQRR